MEEKYGKNPKYIDWKNTNENLLKTQHPEIDPM